MSTPIRLSGMMAILLVGTSFAQDAPVDVLLDELGKYSIVADKDVADQEDVATDPDQAKQFVLREQPIMNWSNPTYQDQRGAIYVWLHDGRPQVIGCCFLNRPDGRESRIHELHSLASGPLQASYSDRMVWRPRPSFAVESVPGTRPPVASPQGRLVQMRQIARRFSGQMSRDDGDRTELRLISRPVYTYQPKTDACTDGAIFALAAEGTDPDAFLVVENRNVEGKPTWVYGLARFHFNALTAQLDGQDVWQVEAKPNLLRNYHGSRNYRDDAYIVFRTY